MSSLDKVLRLAAEHNEEQECYAHLMDSCPWFQAVSMGRGAVSHGTCEAAPKAGKPVKAVVKLTPRTAEASTVVQPTVPPGGPGLFHIKGEHLPPYVEHLYKHLVGRYGKKGAYRVALGVVEKWAKGINPGGWKTKSGKGKRTHPDVQAAAGKNVAEWEASRAKADARTRDRERRGRG